MTGSVFFFKVQGAKAVFILALLLLTSCSSISHNPDSSSPQVKQPASLPNGAGQTETGSEENGWWLIKFSRQWSQQTQWHIDAFIAHQVLKPVLEKYEQQITLWRFHRRSVNDAAGHRFTFAVYSSAKIADEIVAEIEGNSIVSQLLENQVLNKLSYANTEVNSYPAIEDATDKNWAIEIQRAWPYFGMGVSKTWLTLVDQIATSEMESDTMGDTELSLEGKLKVYQQINNKVDELWRDQGGHAFLHHLNALFGYTELFVYERKLRRF